MRLVKSITVVAVISSIMLSLEVEGREVNYIPPEHVAEPIAEKIVERFENACNAECVIDFDTPDADIAKNAFRLLGWSSS
ncbi:MAG: hypothetical protein ACYSRQ_07430, partial [Planctomycetota bacterium]